MLPGTRRTRCSRRSARPPSALPSEAPGGNVPAAPAAGGPGGSGDVAPRLDDAVQRTPVHHEVSQYWKRSGPPRLDRDHITILEASHVQLTGRRPPHWPVGHPVYHEATGAADAF